MKQIERIKTMEQHLDRASQAVMKLSTALDDYAEAQEALRELSAYYGSDEWKQDFADDEQGLLPKDLKRGVLSEDGIWNVLTDSRDLNTRMKEMVKGMTQRYALFFDIDGTLVSFQTHEIPPSTILALTQAKANGSRVYIATGRPPIIITNLGAIEHLIDGFITTNGALCFVGDELVSCQPIDKKDVMTCVEDSKAKGYSLIIVGRQDVAVLDPSGDVDRIFRQMLAVKNLDKASPLDVVLEQDILQLTPFFPAEYEPELMARMPNCVSGRWHPEFTDITANGADKGKGILAIARHEGFDPSRTIAFGDGGNDTSMILQAGIGIAMGNAIDELKQQADYVTTAVDNDGILNALRHFQVI